MIKPQIQEELRRLEDEITACKWTHTDTHTSCSKFTDPVLRVGVEHPKDPKPRSVCVMSVRFCFYSVLPPFVLFCDGD